MTFTRLESEYSHELSIQVERRQETAHAVPPARARQLLARCKAAVYRLQPFTIILKDRIDCDVPPVELKVGPDSKAIGVTLVGHFEQRGAVVLRGANLQHCGQAIKNKLESRRSLRHG